MRVDVKVPSVGESISEAVLIAWFVSDGAEVRPHEALFEIETDKVTMSVEAEAGGRLHIAVPAGTKVSIGAVVGYLETAGAAAGPVAGAAAPAPPPAPELGPPAGFPQLIANMKQPDSQPALTPAVRRLVSEHGVDPAGLVGSGKGGRLTKGDVLAALEAQPAAPVPPAAAAPPPVPAVPLPPAVPAAPLPPPAPTLTAVPAAPAPLLSAAPRQTRRPMSALRARIAERLVMAQHTAAILTTFNEVDMSAVLALRERHGDAFQKRHGARLGMMSFFVKAAVDALRSVPALNAQIQGDEIVENHFYDIGVAVGTPRGLVVPVLRDADQKGFAQIEKDIGDFAERARVNKLTLSELTGGCFTLSNGGVYGSLLSTPILNPPQSGILGMHAIKKRPVVVDDQIVIRPMMYLALSYDHRLVDGAEAVTFLKRIVQCIEAPERLLLDA